MFLIAGECNDKLQESANCGRKYYIPLPVKITRMLSCQSLTKPEMNLSFCDNHSIFSFGLTLMSEYFVFKTL